MVTGVVAAIRKHLAVRGVGWDDAAMVVALLLLNIAGGEHVDDLERLEQDAGLREIMCRARLLGRPPKQRRATAREMSKRGWRDESGRAFPSPSSARRWLERFEHPDTEALRGTALEAGRKAFVPPPTAGLQGLWQVVGALMEFTHRHNAATTATLDIDATCVPSLKRSALVCYKGFRGYQPLNVYWFEQDAVLYSEFRDGNVPAGWRLLPVLKQALEHLPASVQRVRLRSDTAGYEWDFLHWMASGKSPVGRIDFAVGADVNKALKDEVARLSPEDWKPLVRRLPEQDIETRQEYAEVPFVPNEAARSKNGPTFRFIVTREALREQPLPGLEDDKQTTLPFPTIDLPDASGVSTRYKVHALVTILDWAPERVVWWLRERCGRSEEVHAVMKHDLAGGTLPSGLFGANAAWWAIMCLALNLNNLMKRQVLGDGWQRRRMKAVRLHIVNLAGRLVSRAGRLALKVAASAASVLLAARERIWELAADPPGTPA